MSKGFGLQSTERFLVLAAGAIVTVLGLLVLLGWAFEIGALKTVLPGLASMKANTAFCFVLSGIALVTLSSPRAWWVGRLAAGAVLSIALATLAEYLFGIDLGIDELLFRDPDMPDALHPGRMAPVRGSGECLPASEATLAARRRRCRGGGLRAPCVSVPAERISDSLG